MSKIFKVKKPKVRGKGSSSFRESTLLLKLLNRLVSSPADKDKWRRHHLSLLTRSSVWLQLLLGLSYCSVSLIGWCLYLWWKRQSLIVFRPQVQIRDLWAKPYSYDCQKWYHQIIDVFLSCPSLPAYVQIILALLDLPSVWTRSPPCSWHCIELTIPRGAALTETPEHTEWLAPAK